MDDTLLAAVINLSGTLVIFAQSPEMEWHPDDQPEQNDRDSDLKPDNTAQLSEHYLKPGAPRFWYLIGNGLDRMRNEAKRLADPLWMVDEGGEDQRPRSDRSQKTKRVGFGPIGPRSDGSGAGRASSGETLQPSF